MSLVWAVIGLCVLAAVVLGASGALAALAMSWSARRAKWHVARMWRRRAAARRRAGMTADERFADPVPPREHDRSEP